jgi:O-methyltransferase
LNPKLVKLIKEVLFASPMRKFFFPRYIYMFSPPQLCFLCQCIEDTRYIEGAIGEVGCAAGATTIFLNKYMEARNIEKAYYAIDTFSGFASEDVEFEVKNRGKTKDQFDVFQTNKKRWFDTTMQENGVERVRSIEADVNKFDLTQLEPLSFCLLDVDLYKPMKKALRELYEILSPGGVIAVDDCNPSSVRWDGSDQAYKEFMKEIGKPAQVVHDKIGIINKPIR